MQILLILAKTPEKKKLNFSCSALFCMKTRVSLKYFVNDCSALKTASSKLVHTESLKFLNAFSKLT